MAVRFACLGSGSGGNAWVVASGSTRVLLDAGFSGQETAWRLGRLGLSPADLDAVILTHEHGDHVRGAGVLARRFRLPVWATAGTARAVARLGPFPELHAFRAGEPIVLGDLCLDPFAVLHDAAEPCAFVVSDGDRRLGLATDLGCVTPPVEAALAACHALVLECNHDLDMLRTGPYPASLKQRVGGAYGHLSNAQGAALLGALLHGHLGTVVAAHLSAKNNRPALAQGALAQVLGCAPAEVRVADQHQGLDWHTV
ncbi:MAG: MBL fold metallo-hydrolase [Pseudomonadota bacterium]